MIVGLSLTNGIESEEKINRESNRVSCLFWWKFKTKPELWFPAFFFFTLLITALFFVCIFPLKTGHQNR